MNLSKSLYTKGIQCPKALWLKKYKPSVLTPPNESAQAVFENGNIVGDLACQLFPNGKEVAFSENFSKMLETTQKYLDEKEPFIYEATFEYQDILVMVDILKVESDGVRIYEVKSSTSLKDIYLHDVSIQFYVLKKLGFHVKSSHVVYINTEYVRGKALELEKLFMSSDVSSEVETLALNIPNTLAVFQKHLEDRKNEPAIEIGSHCKKPYECDAKKYCWQTQRGIPDYSIFNIFNLGSKKQRELYSKGIVKIEDIPDGFAMTANQAKAVGNYKNKTTYIDAKNIKAFCAELTYPIYHLDFETFQQAVPEYEGLAPYEQIPFQYSLHIEYFDGTCEHKEFLAKDGIDPREQLVKRLVKDIPNNVTVLAYNMSFEKGVIKRLAHTYKEYSEHLLNLNEHMKDLMTPFQKKWYVTPEMQGSYSIKYVLPALVPELAKAYKELEGVQNGSQAMNAFANLTKLDEAEKEKLRASLLAYCKLDTLAMVKILQILKKL